MNKDIISRARCPKKRRRLFVSCSECRRRKVKCDRSRPFCKQCREHNLTQHCHYDLRTSDTPENSGVVTKKVFQELKDLKELVIEQSERIQQLSSKQTHQLDNTAGSLRTIENIDQDSSRLSELKLAEQFDVEADERVDFYEGSPALMTWYSRMNNHAPLAWISMILKDPFLAQAYFLVIGQKTKTSLTLPGFAKVNATGLKTKDYEFKRSLMEYSGLYEVKPLKPPDRRNDTGNLTFSSNLSSKDIVISEEDDLSYINAKVIDVLPPIKHITDVAELCTRQFPPFRRYAIEMYQCIMMAKEYQNTQCSDSFGDGRIQIYLSHLVQVALSSGFNRDPTKFDSSAQISHYGALIRKIWHCLGISATFQSAIFGFPLIMRPCIYDTKVPIYTENSSNILDFGIEKETIARINSQYRVDILLSTIIDKILNVQTPPRVGELLVNLKILEDYITDKWTSLSALMTPTDADKSFFAWVLLRDPSYVLKLIKEDKIEFPEDEYNFLTDISDQDLATLLQRAIIDDTSSITNLNADMKHDSKADETNNDKVSSTEFDPTELDNFLSNIWNEGCISPFQAQGNMNAEGSGWGNSPVLSTKTPGGYGTSTIMNDMLSDFVASNMPSMRGQTFDEVDTD
ncbi:hypothetical protein HII12_003070 [Brettanomyces bruxellensis]|uniref:Zn(2)-C6 fungal-type domain-containing protein n=1 Tax=Dekkera bruxellensis TaxID=5007 RepID=A0A8H6BDD4_DEKBR|nr:hypothetical protein HII12_003070 [Brettanomyces bruxellensis]